jgi:hypothetical protein
LQVGIVSPARRQFWRDNMVKLALLLFGAGVAWGTVKIDARTMQDRQAADHAAIGIHEVRLDQIEQCLSGMEATQLAMLEQLQQMNENVQSINEFLWEAAAQ